MKILEYLCCPDCKADLEVDDGGLRCRLCANHYSVEQGVPVLVDLEHLPGHLRRQIDYFANEKITNRVEYKLSAWQKSYLDRFRENFNQIEGKIIVDCGAGSGYMSIELAKAGANVIACDLTLRNLVRLKEVAEKKRLKNILFACCNAESLPIRNDIVDYFISNAVLEHLPKEKEAISEINRVCRADAGLMLAVPIRLAFTFPLFLPLYLFADKMIGHLRRYDKRDILKKFSCWRELSVYFTGHLAKVFRVLGNTFLALFDEEKIEEDDREAEKNPRWSSIIIVFLRRDNISKK